MAAKKEHRRLIEDASQWNLALGFQGLLVAEVYTGTFGPCDAMLPTVDQIMLDLDDADRRVRWVAVNVAGLVEAQRARALEDDKGKREADAPRRADEGDAKEQQRSSAPAAGAAAATAAAAAPGLAKLEQYSDYARPNPLWLFFKNGVYVDALRSASPPLLTSMVHRHALGGQAPTEAEAAQSAPAEVAAAAAAPVQPEAAAAVQQPAPAGPTDDAVPAATEQKLPVTEGAAAPATTAAAAATAEQKTLVVEVLAGRGFTQKQGGLHVRVRISDTADRATTTPVEGEAPAWNQRLTLPVASASARLGVEVAAAADAEAPAATAELALEALWRGAAGEQLEWVAVRDAAQAPAGEVQLKLAFAAAPAAPTAPEAAATTQAVVDAAQQQQQPPPPTAVPTTEAAAPAAIVAADAPASSAN